MDCAILFGVMTPVILFFFDISRSTPWRNKLAGVYRYAREAGWQVQSVDVKARDVPVRRLLEQWRPVGCIVDRAATPGRPPRNLFGGTPVVYIDQDPANGGRDITGVLHDCAATARPAIDELLSSGVADFAYVPHEAHHHWCDERRNAMASAVRSAGRKFHPVRREEDIAAQLEALPKPCGVLAANDATALRVEQACHRCGLTIPDDILLVGIDNDEFICENMNPPLSSVLPDFERAGYWVAQLLDERIRAPDAPPKQLVYGPALFVRRRSSRRFAQADPRVSRALVYLAEKLRDPSFKVDNVASVMKCSRRLADLRFREVTGHSILEELHELRFEMACRLLKSTTIAIDAIPSQCGYSSSPFLKKLFKKRTGLTMRAWRKANTTTR